MRKIKQGGWQKLGRQEEKGHHYTEWSGKAVLRRFNTRAEM